MIEPSIQIIVPASPLLLLGYTVAQDAAAKLALQRNISYRGKIIMSIHSPKEKSDGVLLFGQITGRSSAQQRARCFAPIINPNINSQQFGNYFNDCCSEGTIPFAHLHFSF